MSGARPSHLQPLVRSLLALVPVVVLAPGCHHLTVGVSDFWGRDPFASVRTVDATKRFLVGVPRLRDRDPTTDGSNEPSGVFSKSPVRFCAEPSPDAISAVGAAVAANLSEADKLTAALSASLSESVGSIGLRTQTIQLLRDAMYRACEMHASGAMNDEEIALLHYRFNGLMLGLLSIEQLTGAVVARPAIVFAGGNSSVSGQLAAAQEELNKARDSLAQLAADEPAKAKAVKDAASALAKAKQAEADAKCPAPPTPECDPLRAETASAEAEKKKADDEEKTLGEKIDDAKKNVKAMEQSAAIARAATTTSSASGQIVTTAATTPPSSETAEKIGANVAEIVKAVLDKNYSNEMCFIMLTDKTWTADLKRAATIALICAATASETSQQATFSVVARRMAVAAVEEEEAACKRGIDEACKGEPACKSAQTRSCEQRAKEGRESAERDTPLPK